MALASIMIDLTIHNAATAAKVLATTGADICIVDASESDANKAVVIAAARGAAATVSFRIRAQKHRPCRGHRRHVGQAGECGGRAQAG